MFSFFFFKQKTAYEMRISDWSSDVCSSDLLGNVLRIGFQQNVASARQVKAKIDPRPQRGRPLLGYPFRPEAGNGKANADNNSKTYEPDFPAGEGTHGPLSRLQASRSLGRAPCRGRVCQYWKYSVVLVP